LYFTGIDIGSAMTKVAILDADDRIVSSVEVYTGPEHRKLANKVMENALKKAGISFEEISYIIATGYGRLNVPFADRQLTELSCHSRGVASLFPDVKTAIDVGGQDIKCMKVNGGKMVDFVMNDKCAAGTGRYIEVVADVLGVKLEDMGEVSLRATKKLEISSFCTIFTQQEVVSRLSNGEKLEDLIAGVHNALASTIVRLALKLKIEPRVVLTGGVMKNAGMVKAMKENLNCEVSIPENPLLTGAIGAAILGREITMKALAKGEPIETKERRLAEATFFT